MLLVQSIVGILSSAAYLLVWYGGEPAAVDLVAEALNVASAVWYTLVVLLERYSEAIGMSSEAVIGLEVAAALFFFIEAIGYVVAWYYSLPAEGSVIARLVQWREVYFWGHLLNVVPGDSGRDLQLHRRTR